MKMVVCGIVFILLIPSWLHAQYQVVVIKNNTVLARYSVDDFIQYSTSDRKHFKHDAIVELSDTTIITRNDTIPYHHIRLIDVRAQQGGGITLRSLGSYLIAAGVLLPIADLINVTLIQHDTYSASDSEGVLITSGALIGTGALILLLKKPYIKIKMNKHIRIVDRDSPLYKTPRIIQQSPFLNPQKN